MINDNEKSGSRSLSDEIIVDFFDELKGDIYTNNLCGQDFVNLSVSKNFPSSLVRLSSQQLHGEIPSSILNHQENIVTDKIKRKIQKVGQDMFNCDIFDCDIHNVLMAQQAIIMGTCKAGDSILFVENMVQDVSHTQLLSNKLKLNVYHVPLYEKNSEINMMELEQLLFQDSEIKVIMLDRSLELREESLILLRNIVPEHILIVYDCSHNAGLIASGLLPQPLMMGVDIIYGCTNITIPGPSHGFIAYKDRNNAYYPLITNLCRIYNQDGQGCEYAVPLLISLYEMKLFGREYCRQMVDNANTLANSLINEGFSVYSDNQGNFQTHQVYLIIGSLEKTADYHEKKLLLAGIYTDIGKIPGQDEVYGLKLGTQAMTRRGYSGKEFEQLAKMISLLIIKDEAPQKIKYELKSMNERFPSYPLRFSFDHFMNEVAIEEFIDEVLR